MASISTIFGRNQSRRPKLFSKVFAPRKNVLRRRRRRRRCRRSPRHSRRRVVDVVVVVVLLVILVVVLVVFGFSGSVWQMKIPGREVLAIR